MQKRLVILYAVVSLMFLGLLLRVYSLSFSRDLTQAANNQSSYAVKVCSTRGSVYDCNGQRLTENDKEYSAVVSPSAEAIQTLAKGVEGLQRSRILEQLQEGKPFLFPLGTQQLLGEGVSCFPVYQRYSRKPIAPHILGYLDYEGKGISGIEKAFEEKLSAAGEDVLLRYGVDIQQRPLEAVVPEIQGSSAPVEAGVVLTLDKDIQELTQVIAGQMLDKGAVVVMDVNSGQLKAVVSEPSFSPDNIGASLDDVRAPLFNRAFAAYNVGSTFKLLVAAAALEQGISTDFTVDCVGGMEVAGRMVYCHNRAGHRETDMEKALEQSCNPYFIQLGQQVGAEAILSVAENMGFGAANKLAEGMISASGNLPKEANSPLALANLSFGQGELLATPIQIASMVSCIANGGCRVDAQLVLGWTEDGTLPKTEEKAAQHILSARTAKILKEYMIEVVEEGSGTAAKPRVGGAGGKTASAQTGSYNDEGEEIVHAWFAGFYPEQEPQYAIVVLAEGMESGGKYAAPVFKRICEQIAVLEAERQ